MAKYTEGVCADGAGILKDGELITITQVLKELNEAQDREGADVRLNNLLVALLEDTKKRENTERAKVAHYAKNEDYIFAAMSAHDKIMYAQFAAQLKKVIGH